MSIKYLMNTDAKSDDIYNWLSKNQEVLFKVGKIKSMQVYKKLSVKDSMGEEGYKKYSVEVCGYEDCFIFVVKVKGDLYRIESISNK